MRNVVDFGAFVYVGLKHDGLLHRSRLPRGTALAVGDVIEVVVVEVDKAVSYTHLDVYKRQWLARRYGYGAAGVFWTGALASLYEMVIAGFPAIAGAPQFWLLIPLILGYYLYVYALILAFPLLFLDERSLWAAAPRSIGAWGKVWRGVLFGLLYWVVFVGWAGLIGV